MQRALCPPDITHDRVKDGPLTSASAPDRINVDLSLYGRLAQLAGGRHIAQLEFKLAPGARLGEVIDRLKIPPEEKGYVFVNAVLCDVPGLDTSRDLALKDGDHIGVFSRSHMWPYQYRDGIPMSEALKAALRERGAMHHSYTSQ